ncbi:MAG: protein-L-isoaspartate O-methyltransferase [Proteobacteria bacterium]|nr:protein-L-isoaspartate O-methyltransferase [Pseudomonadota bacterium]
MDFATARYNMVEGQIRPNHVTDDTLIDALASLPREAFVPTELRGIAYVDKEVPLGEERYLMAPLVTARLAETAAPGPDDLALVIGSATGYGAAVLSHLAGAVVALESDAGLAQRAAQTLTDLGIDTVAVVEGDLKKGYPDQAPYDVIFFDGAVADIPDEISRQLAEGGRLVSVVIGDGVGKAVLVSRHRGGLSTQHVFDATTPLLPGFEPQEAFVF